MSRVKGATSTSHITSGIMLFCLKSLDDLWMDFQRLHIYLIQHCEPLSEGNWRKSKHSDWNFNRQMGRPGNQADIWPDCSPDLASCDRPGRKRFRQPGKLSGRHFSDLADRKSDPLAPFSDGCRLLFFLLVVAPLSGLQFIYVDRFTDSLINRLGFEAGKSMLLDWKSRIIFISYYQKFRKKFHRKGFRCWRFSIIYKFTAKISKQENEKLAVKAIRWKCAKHSKVAI